MAMSDGYEYDLFLSYTRKGNVPGWMENHFFPLLRDALTDRRPVAPRIFLDTQQETGANWPLNLEFALKRSRYLVAVWSAPYFQSAWGLAEWTSMLERERLLGMGGLENPQGLVYPVVFADGDSFPERAREVQARMDLKRWAFPFPGFRETPAYLDFFQAMSEVAETLAARLDLAPAWRPDWPVVRPPRPQTGSLPQPRL
jgi:hypothetical protein